MQWKSKDSFYCNFKIIGKDGITIRNNIKANIDKKMLFSILQSEYIQFDASDFTTAQKWIIFHIYA